MADMLQQQYTSVFSDPNCPLKKTPSTEPNTFCSLSDMKYTEDDVAMNTNTDTSEDDIPARIYKNCKTSKPIHMIWWLVKILCWWQSTPCSRDPAHKGGKIVKCTDCAKYRPIGLTSHLVKLFQRTIRSRIVDFLEANKILSLSQQGFRKTTVASLSC